MYMENYASSLDTQTLDAKRLEVEKCAYVNCGYTFLDIHSHYWQFHQEYIRPNMRTTNYTKDTVTGFQESNVDQIRSNLEEDTESVDKEKPLGKQELIAVVAAVAQPAKDENHNVPDEKTDLKLVPALKSNTEVGTNNREDGAIQVKENEETDRVKGRKDKNKDVDERETGSDSSARAEPANDVLKNDNLKEGTKESAKPEPGENPEIKGGENSVFDTYNGLIGKPCEKVLHKESSLNLHLL